MASRFPSVDCEPIGIVRSPRTAKRDDEWGGVESRIELDAETFGPEALRGLEEFSHAEIVFYLHRVDEDQIEWGSRRPRNNAAWPEVGIFAQRGKGRPNRLGISRCRVRRVDGTTVHVTGLDAIDGTPVLDIKPYMEEFGPHGELEQPRWAVELMERYYDSS